MTPTERERLIADLQSAREQISTLLLSVADDQDWQPDPDNWSFRYIAAHMAACDRECLQVRVGQIASGTSPRFEFYDNTGRDFSGLDLRASLDEWAATRTEVLHLFRALPDVALTLTGSHKSYGQITIPDYLRIMLDHDQGHLRHLEDILAQYRAEQAS